MDLSYSINVLSLVIVTFGAVGTIAVMKYMLDDHRIRLMNQDKRLDKHGDDLVKLNTLSSSAITAEDVRAEYVSKELFNQYEKNVEQHFTTIEGTQKEILELLRKP